jgi:hypothetical protein
MLTACFDRKNAHPSDRIQRVQSAAGQRLFTCFDQAARWMETRWNLAPQLVAESVGFRAEAETVLSGSGGELLANVFTPD